VYAKLVLGLGILGIGFRSRLFGSRLSPPLAFVGYVFPTEYLGSLGRRRKAQLMRELPDFLALVRPLAESPGLERAMATVADELHAASDGENLLARQVRSAIAAYGTGVNFYAALADVAAAADLEDLDELAAALGQARDGQGCPTSWSKHERRSGRASGTGCSGRLDVQLKLAAISPRSTCPCSSC
jgi:Flp pilus assembly protein TadB